MGSNSKISYNVTHTVLMVLVCSSVLLSVHSVPVEIVYNGEACGCPSKLGYQVLAPILHKPKPYRHSLHGYRVEVPVQAKAKVSYSFDFTVEEPRTPAPPKPARLKLYAKVDRIALNKPDCPATAGCPRKQPQLYAAGGVLPPCTCGQCDAGPQPAVRYVNKKQQQAAKCRHFNCKCNMVETINSNDIADMSANLIDLMNVDAIGADSKKAANGIRKKRELLGAFMRPRPFRRARFVKLYHKSLPTKRQALFALNEFPKSMLNKPFFLKGKRAKRNIKGEYDLLEKEREQIDLTLPEIVQYMPETLLPDFKRGRCSFGCNSQKRKQQESQQQQAQPNVNAESKSLAAAKSMQPKIETLDDNFTHIQHGNDDSNAAVVIISSSSGSKNTGSSAYKLTPTVSNAAQSKRNANYHENYGIPAISAVSASHIPIKPQLLLTQLPAFFAENADRATAIDSRYTATETSAAQSYNANAAYLPQQYVYDRLPSNHGSLRVKASAIPDPTGSDAAPLYYAGELESQQPHAAPIDLETAAIERDTYPVQHMSNDELDKIISDIIYKHPAFVDATTHLNGALVDPEPLQEQETKEFIKKLLEGRFNYLFTNDNEANAAALYPSADHYSAYA